MGRVLPHARQAPRRRHGAAVAGQGTVLQQHQRHRCGLRMRRRVRSGRTAACVIIKHANPCGVPRAPTCSRPTARRSPAILTRLRRHHRAQPQARCRGRARDRRDLHRGDHRAGCERRGQARSSPRRRICGFCSPAACPIRSRKASRSESLAGGFLVQSRDNGVSPTAELKVVTKRTPTDAELPTSSSPSPWRSTSSRTRSSMPGTAPPSASAQGRCPRRCGAHGGMEGERETAAAKG